MSNAPTTVDSVKMESPAAGPFSVVSASPKELRAGERAWLEEIGSDREPSLLLRTQTSVDVGGWFRSGRVWIACLPGRVAVFAHGRRPYREVVETAAVDQSFYNFLTGELALVPTVTRVRRVKLPPLEAQQILAHINRRESSHA